MESSNKLIAVCPNDHKLLVGRKLAGRRIVCPKCQAETQVPPVPMDQRPAAPPPLPPRAPAGAAEVMPPLPPRENASLAEAAENRPPVQNSPSKIRQASASVQGYRAEPSWVSTTRWLALAIAVLACFQLLPVLVGGQAISAAPTWSKVIGLLVLIQLGVALQMALLPDWSTVRAALFLLAAVATCYGLVLGMLMMRPANGQLPWDLSDARDKAPLWCLACLLLLGLLIYATGTVAHRWRKAFAKMHG